MAKKIILPYTHSLIREMAIRKSTRKYLEGNVDFDAITRLLWAAYGKNDFKRTVPSAGAIYPLTIYLLWKGTLYRYDPETHLLETLKTGGGLQEGLYQACIRQSSVLYAPIVFIVTANYGKIKRKYKGRGERYAILEAGHVGQNVHLMCEALGLGCVMIGAFSDGKVKAVLGVDEDPLYVIPVGRI